MRRCGPVIALGILFCAACTTSRATDAVAALERAQEAARRGALTEALGLVDEQLAAVPQADHSAVAWRLRLLRADLLVTRRDLDRAADVLEATLPPDPALTAVGVRQRYLKARVAVERGQLAQALEMALAARQLEGIDDDTRGDLDLLVGRIHLQEGRWSDAEAVLARVLAPGGDRFRQLQALNNLGNGRLRSGRYDEALVWLERALSLSDYEQTQAYGTALVNAGICYSRLGLFDRALDIQRRAVDIQRAQGGSKALVEALGSLGVTHGLRDDHEGALPYFQQALDAAVAAGLSADAALAAGNLASAYAHLGRWDLADAANQRSVALAGAGPSGSVYNILNAAEIAAGRNQADLARRLYHEAIASARAPAVQWSAETGLAELALRQGDVSEATRRFDSAVGLLERTRSDLQRTDYRLSFLSQLIEFYQAYVDALVGQGRSDRALEIADSSRGRVLAERQQVAAPAHVTTSGFQRAAGRTRSVILTYWLAPKRSFLWVITGTGTRRIDLPGAAEIDAAVRDYRALIETSTANPLARTGTAGDVLYRMVVAPAGVPRNASVVIVPDGSLHNINFETLPVDGATRHYWIEDVQIQVAPALSMLAPASAASHQEGRLLLIGNPTPRPPDFPALKNAPTEMTNIVRHFPQSRVSAYQSAEATPAVYQGASLAQFSMIHFTAHATANLDSPLDSAVILSGPDTAYKLYARDVADRALTADLVTVSACRSAGERAYSGEGLVGFAWAFLRAGARRVVAGLWDVDDESTAQLMAALYGGIAEGQTPASALRTAKLALLANGGRLAQPYYWGPFQLFTVAP